MGALASQMAHLGCCRLPAVSCGRCLWEDSIPVLMKYLCQIVFWCFLKFSHRSFLGATWENSTVFQNSWPLGDEIPPAWIIKAQRDCSEKSTWSSAWGRRSLLERALRSLGSFSDVAEHAQSSSSLMGWDAEIRVRCISRAPCLFSH